MNIGSGYLERCSSVTLAVSKLLLTKPSFHKNLSALRKEVVDVLALLAEAHRTENQKALHALLEARGVFERARDMALGHMRRGLAFIESLPESPAATHLRQVCTLMADRSV